jgi:hypothetical protein
LIVAGDPDAAAVLMRPANEDMLVSPRVARRETLEPFEPTIYPRSGDQEAAGRANQGSHNGRCLSVGNRLCDGDAGLYHADSHG